MTKDPKDVPVTSKDEVRPDWLFGFNPNAIERQEAQGQAALVESPQLPVNGSEDPCFEKMGIIWGDPTPGDEIFRQAQLPEGWKKQPTDHAMWSHLVDDKGRVRARIFYKAAFYDRSAFIRPVNRFSVESDYSTPEKTDRSARCSHVMDCGKEVYSTGIGRTKADPEDRMAFSNALCSLQDKQITECEAWLRTQGYPDWKDPSKYWD